MIVSGPASLGAIAVDMTYHPTIEEIVPTSGEMVVATRDAAGRPKRIILFPRGPLDTVATVIAKQRIGNPYWTAALMEASADSTEKFSLLGISSVTIVRSGWVKVP